jgi:hypothetical protein
MPVAFSVSTDMIIPRVSITSIIFCIAYTAVRPLVTAFMGAYKKD